MIGKIHQQQTDRERRRHRQAPTGQYVLERRLEDLLNRVRGELAKPNRRQGDRRLVFVLKDLELEAERIEAALRELVQGPRAIVVKPVAAAHPLTPGGAELLELVRQARDLAKSLIEDRDAAGLEELCQLRDDCDQALEAFGDDHAETA